MGDLVTHNPVSQSLRIPDGSMPWSGTELRYGVPPLPTNAAELNKLVEITMHELAERLTQHCRGDMQHCRGDMQLQILVYRMVPLFEDLS